MFVSFKLKRNVNWVVINAATTGMKGITKMGTRRCGIRSIVTVAVGLKSSKTCAKRLVLKGKVR